MKGGLINLLLDDPLMICAALMRFRRELDLMYCPKAKHADHCACAKLKQLYGKKTFRCEYMGCEFYARGFGTLLEREQHLLIHRKPFKCPERDCLFAELGFSSSGDLSHHMQKTHIVGTAVDSGLSNTALSQLPRGDIYRILEDFIRDDQVRLVESLLSIAREIPNFRTELRKLLFLAAATASGDMIAILLDAAETEGDLAFNLNQGLAVAIDAEFLYFKKVARMRCRPQPGSILA